MQVDNPHEAGLWRADGRIVRRTCIQPPDLSNCLGIDPTTRRADLRLARVHDASRRRLPFVDGPYKPFRKAAEGARTPARCREAIERRLLRGRLRRGCKCSPE